MRKLATAAISFAVAVFGSVYLLPQAWLLPAAAFCTLLGAVLWWWAGQGRRPKRAEERLRVLLVALGLGLGFLWCRGYDSIFLAPARALEGTTVAAEAVVVDWPEEISYGAAVTVRLKMPHRPDVKMWLKTGMEGRHLKPGDEISVTASLSPADRMAGEATEYFHAEGIFLLGDAQGQLTVRTPERVAPRDWPRYASRAIQNNVAACFPKDTAGFMAALLTGDKARLDPVLYGAMQRTGIAHVVAVSGLHVSFFAGLLALLFSRRRRLGAGVIIFLLLFFAAVAGNSPSVLRAVYLQSALLLAPLFGREDDKCTSLAAVLMLLLMWNPYGAASVSLQLSFAAVAGIYLVTGRLYSAMTGGCSDKGAGLPKRLGNKAVRVVAASLATTLGALIFTTPLMALYFGMISLIAPLANLLTLWAVSDAFMVGLLAALGTFLWPALGGALAQLGAVLVRFVQGVAVQLGRLPFAAVPMSSPYLRLWFCATYGVLILYLLWRGEKKRPIIPLCACGLTLCVALFLGAQPQVDGAMAVAVLNVGQGQSVLFTSGEAKILVDCGGNGRRDAGDVAASAVQQSGSNRLDLLVLTHYHADHANGVATLMARLDVAAVALPDVEPEDALRAEILALAEEEGAEVIYVTEDSAVTFGEGSLRLYAPLGDGGANEEGLSVLATAGDFDVLLTGDMNAAVEKRLVKYGALPDIEVFVAGHHGSAYASSEELLWATRPEYAVISVGYNSYGHPSPVAMERLAAAGCEIYRTDLAGTVTITSN